MMRFKNRQEAGQKLAEKLKPYEGKDAVVYALSRGGVIVGFDIAKALHAPLDIIITRKVGHPQNPEYAICAVSEDGQVICNEFERNLADQQWLKQQVKKEQQEAK